jgi:hypothetical protein
VHENAQALRSEGYQPLTPQPSDFIVCLGTLGAYIFSAVLRTLRRVSGTLHKPLSRYLVRSSNGGYYTLMEEKFFTRFEQR